MWSCRSPNCSVSQWCIARETVLKPTAAWNRFIAASSKAMKSSSLGLQISLSGGNLRSSNDRSNTTQMRTHIARKTNRRNLKSMATGLAMLISLQQSTIQNALLLEYCSLMLYFIVQASLTLKHAGMRAALHIIRSRDVISHMTIRLTIDDFQYASSIEIKPLSGLVASLTSYCLDQLSLWNV